MAMCMRSCFCSLVNFCRPLPSSCTPTRNSRPFRSFGFSPSCLFTSSSNHCQLLSSSRSFLSMERFPIFKCTPQVRDHDGASNQCCHTHGLVDFLALEAHLLAFSEVILH